MPKLRVEGFSEKISPADLRQVFGEEAGKIRDIVIHVGNEPPYAFVTIDACLGDVRHLLKRKALGSWVRISHASRPGKFLFED